MVQEIVDFFRYGFDAGGAVFVEAVARIAQQADRLQEVVGDNGHIDVQLEIARRARHADGDVVAEHLAAHHGHRFALGRVDFARHDGRTRLVFGDFDFAQTAARAACQPADVVGDFVQACRQRFQCARSGNGGIASAQGFKFVRRAGKRQAGQFGEFGGGFFGVFGMAVQTRTDRRSAQGEFVQTFERVVQTA